MNYKIINDKEALLDFVHWLPELRDNEMFYVSLFARNKYVDASYGLKADKTQLKSFTAKKSLLFNKIQQLEVALGVYQQRNKNDYDDLYSIPISIPQEALALYIMPNPRNLELAAKNSVKKLLDLVIEPYSGYNPNAVMMTEMHKACSRKVYMDFDFDFVEPQVILRELEGKINFTCLNVLKTKGGFHLMVNTSLIEKQYKNSWYVNITALPGMDKNSVNGDALVPVPGCCQSTFTPHFVSVW